MPRTTPARRRSTPAPADSRFPDLPFPLPRVTAAARRRAAALLDALAKAFPDAHCELDYSSPHELLIATILSAQTTDAAVNKATPALFARFPTPADYARAKPEDIEPYIRSLGFFRNKARAIHRSMTDVVERFGGQVPRTMAELLTLHGVARKTANVVLGNAFGVNEGIPVDTHVERLAQRYALVKRGTTVQMIERTLMALFPRDQWCTASHRLIWQGRYACKARCPNGPGGGCYANSICERFGTACECRGRRPAPAAPRRARRPAGRPTGSR
jgi:endonuclease-3